MSERQSILMVDDRPENLFALEKVLEEVDVDCVKAGSGDQALAATLKQDFALAVLDVQMPGMDGYELAELLRGDPKTHSMPIVFLTAAYAEEAQIFKGYEAGAVDYIVKPYNPVILVAKVRAFLEMDRNRRELQEHRDHLDRLVAARTAELQAANEALRRSNVELEQFAYVASHDLQEPLRMVASYAQLIKKRYRGQLDEKADLFIDYTVEGAKRMQGLINDLLLLSRVGTRGKDPKPTDCSKILELVLQDLELAVEESGARISCGDLPRVLADGGQLGQIFQNLISNAIKFCGDEVPQVRIDARREGAFWWVDVKDQGIGIDPKYHERIFVIFQRLHERGRYPGSGIGLAIVKKIIERHGGELRLESEEGKGCTFSFSLPAAPESTQEG